MEHDNIFRIILILGFAAVFPVSIYHRLKAHLASREKLNRRAEGLFILVTLRPIGLVGMAGLLAYMINPAWMSWASFDLPIEVRWLGVVLGVIAGVLLIVVFRSLGTNLKDTIVTRIHHTLGSSRQSDSLRLAARCKKTRALQQAVREPDQP